MLRSTILPIVLSICCFAQPSPVPRVVKLAVGPDLGYSGVLNPLPLPAGFENISVASVAINSKGHIFVFERAPIPLFEFDQNGKYLRSFGEGLVTRSHGLRIDPEDNLWITDVTDNTVIKLSPEGQVLMTLGTRGKTGAWDEAAGTHYFNQPTDIAFGPGGDVYVTQGHGGPDPRVFRFAKDGKLITQWSGKVEGPAGFAFAHSVILDAQNDIYIADREAKRIVVFDRDGKYLRAIQTANLVCALYVTRDNQLFVLSGQDGQIEKFDWSGKLLGVAGAGIGKDVGQFGEAHYMAMDARGDIYVADTDGKRLQKFVRK